MEGEAGIQARTRFRRFLVGHQNFAVAWTPNAGPNSLHAADPQKPAKVASELAVAVEYDVAVGTRARKSLSQLLNDPITGGVSRHVEMQNPPPMMLDHKKAVQHAEGQCRDREESRKRQLPRDGSVKT